MDFYHMKTLLNKIKVELEFMSIGKRVKTIVAVMILMIAGYLYLNRG